MQKIFFGLLFSIEKWFKITFGLYIGVNEEFWKNFREWKRTVTTIFYHLEMVKIKKN